MGLHIVLAGYQKAATHKREQNHVFKSTPLEELHAPGVGGVKVNPRGREVILKL